MALNNSAPHWVTNHVHSHEGKRKTKSCGDLDRKLEGQDTMHAIEDELIQTSPSPASCSWAWLFLRMTEMAWASLTVQKYLVMPSGDSEEGKEMNCNNKKPTMFQARCAKRKSFPSIPRWSTCTLKHEVWLALEHFISLHSCKCN